ncbi:conserved Plasmodium protein, unknown function [Plasmodium sp. gorilla clade G3]|nr:conserved Plasmodium protein, unknown function [Plasmodium sp. gorilla clade G3]
MRIKNKFPLISLECLQVNLIIPFYKKKTKSIDNHCFLFRRFNSFDKIYSLDKNCTNLSFQYKNNINHIDDKNELNHNFIDNKTNFFNKQTSENKNKGLQNKNDNTYKDFHSGSENDDGKFSNNFFFCDHTHEYKNNEINDASTNNTYEYKNNEINDASTNNTYEYKKNEINDASIDNTYEYKNNEINDASTNNTYEYKNYETNDASIDNTYEYTSNEYNEDVDDDLDTLLLTNNLNSSLIGELWHASANSIYKNKKKLDVHDENKNKKQINDIAETSTNIIKQINNSVHTNMNLPQKLDNQKCQGNFSNLFVNEIYEKEEKETQKMKEYLEHHEEHFSMFRNSILCKLRIAEELSRNANHSSKENINKYNKNKEEHYKNLIDSINNTNHPRIDLNNNHYNNKKKKKKNYYYYPVNNNINYDHVETIKILDIDNIPCNILNNLFAYNIVKNCSAELCLKIISRLGMYRDKYSQISYENMINYLGQVLNCSKNAEIIALFSRCYETISIPFLVNYVRKYGTFSRAFIVNMYDKYFKKRLFDFVRYENNNGIRKLPNILTHPYHLSSYTKLLGECSAKKDMYVQLKILGHIPDTFQITEENKSEEEINYLMNAKKDSNKKKIHNINNIDLIDNATEKKKKKKSSKFIERPKIYDLILSSEYTGLPIEHFIDHQKKIEDNKHTNNVIKTLSNNEIIIEHDILHNDFILNDELDKENKKQKIIINDKQNDDILNVNNNNKKCIQSTYNMNKLNIQENHQNEENVHFNNNENTNFILDDDCDIYVYKRFNKLNNSSFKMQTTLVKTETNDEKKQNNEIDLFIEKGKYFEEIDIDQNNKSLWKLPWNNIKKDSFYFKGRFFKIVPNEGWSEIKELSKNYIKPKRRRTQHYIKRQRILQKKIKVNLFKKKILENYNKMKKQKNEIK